MQEFKVGQKVTMIDEVFEGMVVKVKNHHLIVQDADGFDFEIEKNKVITKDLNEIMHHACKNLIPCKDSQENHKPIASPKTKLKPNQKGVIEVDLHVEKLYEKVGWIPKNKILAYQVNYAEQVLSSSLQKKCLTMIFIHGVGQGKLKSALFELFRKYHLKWHDADFNKYGIGATEVFVNNDSEFFL